MTLGTDILKCLFLTYINSKSVLESHLNLSVNFTKMTKFHKGKNFQLKYDDPSDSEGQVLKFMCVYIYTHIYKHIYIYAQQIFPSIFSHKS